MTNSLVLRKFSKSYKMQRRKCIVIDSTLAVGDAEKIEIVLCRCKKIFLV